MRYADRTRSVPTLQAADHAATSSYDRRSDRRLAWKHGIDRVAAAILIVLTLPLLVAAAAALKLSSQPVLVRERRLNREGRSFEMFTFGPLPVLRRWAIDQLPQLFNVLRGQMSFVGPRPERPEFVELFGENIRRHDGPQRVRPGITGWAQMRGLDDWAPLAERVRWDDFYVENWSPWLDAKIVALTLRNVARGPQPD
jgi:lipopolysaccharide/colanic/teichoic acid biosynthesis glycosyltransferase